MITAQPDILGTDTIVGPGYVLGGAGKSILDVALDKKASQAEKTEFENGVLFDMRAGKNGTATFDLGGEQGRGYVAFAPVNARALKGTNPSIFKEGVDVWETLVYSLAIVIPEADLTLPFTSIKSEIEDR